MGQTVSKVTNRVVASRSSNVGSGGAVTTTTLPKITTPPPPHIPSIPGKTSADAAAMGITSTMVVDPITGFTRGTAPLTPSEDRQRQFLEARQYDFMMKIQQQQQQQRPNEIHRHRTTTTGSNSNTNSTTTTTSATSTSATTTTTSSPLPPFGTDTKMPDDLLNFIKDMGPVIRSPPKVQHSSTDEHLKRRTPRVSRMIPSSDLNTERDIDPDQTTTTTTTTTTATTTVQQKPGHDKTRITTNMPLANNIPGYETSRTTSFSTKLDIPDPNEIPGYTMVQFYGVLWAEHMKHSKISQETMDTNRDVNRSVPLSSSSSSSSSSSCTEIMETANAMDTTQSSSPSTKQKEHEQLLQNAYKYMRIPVLLKDTDGSYIGAHREHVPSLLGAHKGMKLLNTSTQAKLVLQELYERTADVTARTTPTNAATVHPAEPQQPVVVVDLGPSKAASASR